MTLYLATDTTQPNSPISATPGMGFEGKMAPRIYDYLYAVDTIQYDSPMRQVLGWGYSTKFHTPVAPELPVIPPWMAEDYPFVEPSQDITGFVIDTLLSFEDPKSEFEVPIYLRRITKHADGLYSVRFVDANENVIFDSTYYSYGLDSIDVEGDTYKEKADNKKGNCVYKWKEWGTLYELLYWETELITLKMIIRRTTITSDSAIRQFSLYPDNAELDARAIYQYPKRIRSLIIDGKVISPKTLVLKTGYNLSIESNTDAGLRTRQVLTLSAARGSGSGIAPANCDCDELSKPITMINGVKPTATGSIYFNADMCHTIGGESSVVMGNGCTPCCECKDMTEAGKLLNTVEDEYYCIGGQTKVVADKLKDQVNNLRSRVEEEESEGPSYEYSIQEGNRLFIPFKFAFRNMHKYCIHDLQVTIKAEHVGLDFRRLKQTGPVVKDYSDCYVIDEMETPDVEWDLHVDREEDESDAEYVARAKIERGKRYADVVRRRQQREKKEKPFNKQPDEKIEEYDLVVRWKLPIQSMQQVSLTGVYRTNTHYQEYDSWLYDIRYYDDCDNEIAMVIEEDKQSVNYGPWDDMRFEDFTGLLTGDELRILEDEIRQQCLKDEVDVPVRRNTVRTEEE